MIKYRFAVFFLFLGGNIYGQNRIHLFESKVDSIIFEAIDSMAFPGCQLLVATKDSILFEKSYGYHTYDKVRKVENDHLYDLASVTKVTSGLLLLMKMVDKKMIDLDGEIGDNFSILRGSNKHHLTLRQILAHQAGLIPYIVFWKDAIKPHGFFGKNCFRTGRSKKFNIPITDQLFLSKNYPKRMYRRIRNSEVVPAKQAKYRYSGLFFLLLPRYIEEILKADYESQLRINFYDRMGLDRLLYRPLEKYPLGEIVPTELDTFFRHTLVHGYVHDENAAMMNSKSCNAGLFANARNLAKIFMMLMNGGVLDGKRYLSQAVIKEFTSYQYPENDNRRGLGFDKPLLEYNEEDSYVSKYAGKSSFGHSGYTGTFVWADPEANLLVILLTNRVHPYRSQRKLYTMSIRPAIHDQCYKFFTGMSDNN